MLRAKGHFLTTFLFCFGPITGGYYPLLMGLAEQCKRGHLDPLWAMWIPNGILCVLGLYVIRRLLQH